ncbi:MAG: radical SAM protein [Lachnotalea sp.]
MKNNYYLGTVAIDLTYKCPFRCLHCFNTSGEHPEEFTELTDDEWLSATDDIMKLNVGQLSIGGGEATVRKDLLLDIAYKLQSTESEIEIAMVSNGYLLDEDLAAKLSAANVKSVQISVDGFKENYERIRQMDGGFDRALNAIKCLVDVNVSTAVSFAPTTFNISDLEELVDYLYNMGVRIFRCQPLMLLGRAEKYLKDFIPTYENYRTIATIIEQKKIKYPDMYIEWGDPLDHLVRGRIRPGQLSYVTIGAYGDLFVSPYLPLIFGNIKKHSLQEYLEGGLLDVWSNEFLKKMAEKISDTNNMDLAALGLPKIFTDSPIELDVLSANYEKRTQELVNKFF